MATSRLALITCTLLVALTSAGFFHRAPALPNFKTWKDALEVVPCKNVSKDGKDFKVTWAVIVDGKSFSSRTIREPDLIEVIERRCFPKH